MKYIFDTSSLSNIYKNIYEGRFPSFWEKYKVYVSNGDILSVREVVNELKNNPHSTKQLLDFMAANPLFFNQSNNDELLFVGEIFKVPHFRLIIGNKQMLKGTPVADPFVVARARINGACVVTQEGVKANAVKIPNICEHFKIPCTNIEGFMERERWKW